MSPWTKKQQVVARIAKHDPGRLFKRNRGMLDMTDEQLTEMEHGPTKKKKPHGWKRSGGSIIQ